MRKIKKKTKINKGAGEVSEFLITSEVFSNKRFNLFSYRSNSLFLEINNHEIIKNNQLFLKNQPAVYDKTDSFEVFNSLFSFRVATEKRCKRTHSKLFFFFFKF